MENIEKWSIEEEEKQKMISTLTRELQILRIKAGISQEDLSALVGISRQTYGAIERGTRQMSWNTFLALILVFDYNNKTHSFLHSIGAFPQELFNKINDGIQSDEISLEMFLGESSSQILGSLDQQAISSIRTLIMLEYARCTSTPGEVIIKSFDGKQFVSQSANTQNIEAMKALRAIKGNQTDYEQP